MADSSSTESIPSTKHTLWVVQPRHNFNSPRFDEIYKTDEDLSTMDGSSLSSENSGVSGKLTSHFKCSRKTVKNCILSCIPCIRILSKYKIKSDLLSDVTAGLVVGIVIVPQSIAYAILSDVPPVYGLYSSFFPPLIYFIFGTSRHISMGMFALGSLMIGNEVQKYCPGNPGATPTPQTAATTFSLQNIIGDNTTGEGSISRESSGLGDQAICSVSIALLLAFLSGVFQLVLGIFQLGFISTYMSLPLSRSFSCSSSILVLASQIKGLFQIQLPRYSGPLSVFYMFRDLFPLLPTCNYVTLGISVLSIFILAVVNQHVQPRFRRKFKAPFPIELILVVTMTVASDLGEFNAKYGVDTIGKVATGIPPPSLPPFSGVDLVALLPAALSLAFVGYANATTYSKMAAKEKGYELDGNQELIAHGLTNILGSCCNSVLASASLSRSALAMAAGAVTQVFSLVSCLALLIVMMFMGHLMEPLPKCVFSAIVIVSLKDLIMLLRDLKKLWYIDRVDFLIWVMTFLFTILLDPVLGLLASLIFVLLTIVYRSQKPLSSVLGHVPNTEMYADIKRNQKAKELSGIKVFRFDSSLHFANSEQFVKRLYTKTRLDPLRVRRQVLRAEKRTRRSSDIEVIIGDASQSSGLGSGHNVKPDVMSHCGGTHTIILDCSVMSYMDSSGASAVCEVVRDYNKLGIRVYLAGCKDNVMRTLEAAGYYNTAAEQVVYLSVHDAVMEVLNKTEMPLRNVLSESTYF